jgi:hypothetical protein
VKKPSLRRHGDWELELALVQEEAMALDTTLPWQNKTARVQVNVSYKDQNGVVYAATRIVKLRVRREKQQEFS